MIITTAYIHMILSISYGYSIAMIRVRVRVRDRDRVRQEVIAWMDSFNISLRLLDRQIDRYTAMNTMSINERLTN